MTRKTYTVRDYLKRMAEQSGGHGLFGHSCRSPQFWATQVEADPYEMVKAVDEETVALAMKRGWSFDTLCEFADSRAGRHCGDAMTFIGQPPKLKKERVVTIDSCLRAFMTEFEKEPR